MDKVLGIIGGMGPEATVDFMQRVIRITPAKDDHDHIRMIVDNHPQIPSRIKALIEQTGEDPTDCLTGIARNLEKWGANLIVIPCNTAHYYFDAIQNSVKIPVFNMLELVVIQIRQNHPKLKKIGFLGSTAVINNALYDKITSPYFYSMVYPGAETQEKVMSTIRKIKTSKYTDDSLLPIVNAADELIESGAEVLIIGCTELSATSHVLPNSVCVYDASQILAEAVVKEIKGDFIQ